MNKEQKELPMKEEEDYNYQCFNTMMNSLFDLANELPWQVGRGRRID
ncbi:hypothetical protein MHB54_00550 [Paenibacillus sp. FSL M7-0802]